MIWDIQNLTEDKKVFSFLRGIFQLWVPEQEPGTLHRIANIVPDSSKLNRMAVPNLRMSFVIGFPVRWHEFDPRSGIMGFVVDEVEL
jgi:hypothetical protein